MSKITLTPLVNLQNETTAVNAINNNSTVIQTAFDNTLSRDGTSPNTMSASLDMNTNRILNLPQALNPTDPVRLQEVGDAPTYAANAAASAAASLGSANSSAASAATSTTEAGISTAQAVIATTQAGVATTQAGIATTQAGISTTQATASAASAAAAAATEASLVLGLSDTSTTSNVIGTGAKTFTISSGKLYTAGQYLIISNTGTPANYMHGTVTSYTGTSLVMNITDIGGTGTFSAWTINLSGTQGPSGTGTLNASGTPTINQLATWASSTQLQGVTLTGLVKANGASAPTAATASTDYIAATTGSAIQKASSGGLTAATAGTDYLAPAAIGTTVLAFDAQLFSNIPQNSQSTAYTLVSTDAQKHIYHPSADTTARTITIPANASVAFPIGTAVTFVNDTSAGVMTIAITTDTLVLMGAGTTGSRTLAASGIATAIKVTSTRWVISGTNLT